MPFITVSTSQSAGRGQKSHWINVTNDGSGVVVVKHTDSIKDSSFVGNNQRTYPYEKRFILIGALVAWENDLSTHEEIGQVIISL